MNISKTLLLLLTVAGFTMTSCTTPEPTSQRSAIGTPVMGIGYADILPVGF